MPISTRQRNIHGTMAPSSKYDSSVQSIRPHQHQPSSVTERYQKVEEYVRDRDVHSNFIEECSVASSESESETSEEHVESLSASTSQLEDLGKC